MTDAEKIAAGLSEEWRDVPGYEGHYRVSSEGRVKSIPRVFERQTKGYRQTVRVPGGILAQQLSRKGYPFVCLNKGGSARTLEVHRLVCRVFHGEPPPGMEAAHENGIRNDVRACNLSWKTRSENSQDRRRHGTLIAGEAVKTSKLKAFQAVEICRRALAGERMRGLAREFGVSEMAVRKIKRGTLWAEQTLAVRAIIQGETE
jgi:choline dehydrogenase-like flavoprotein